jgi:fatty-acyl-CoA synthase
VAAPAPGQAPLPAPNAAALLRRNAADADIAGRPAVRFGDRIWSHGEYVAEARRWANLLRERLPDGRPPHVGVLLDNTPDYLFVLGGAAMVGAAVVGLNATRRGEQLQRDIEHADVALLLTEPRYLGLLAPIADDLAPQLLVSRRFVDEEDNGDAGGAELGEPLEDALGAVGDDDPGLEPDVGTTWALVFTSGTSSAPKAVVCSQRRLLTTGNRMTMIMGLGPDDVGYVCMPLFHSNALMVGWMPSLVAGASIGLARRFSASRWLADVRHYGATWFNYTGKPLSYLVATPARPDDADNPLRVAYGNEGAPTVVDAFSQRFAVRVIDAFGATEGGVGVQRTGPPRAGSVGRAGPGLRVVDEQGAARPPARFDRQGRLENAEECVGEIVNTAGAGPFEGYYNNPEANARATRNGWYWSGDLGYLDEDGYLYFAGRDSDWIRVDGENFPAGPVEAALGRHPDVVIAAVYGVPDASAGDQVMATLQLRPGVDLDLDGFAAWVDAQPDLGPKWRPTYLRLATALPSTGTNKVLKRTLVHQKFRLDRIGGDAIFFRPRRAAGFRPFTDADERDLERAFADAGRSRFWDL